MPIAIPTAAALGSFFTSKKFLIPAAIITLLLAIGGGTYFYLKHSTDKAVETAVEQADTKATVQTYETAAKVNDATITIDVKMDKLRDQTIRDYQYVTQRIEATPVEQRQASVPPLLIDTLNDLDRLRSARDAGRVPDDQVPPG